MSARKSIELHPINWKTRPATDSTDSRKEGNRGREKNPLELWRVPEVSLNSSGHDARISRMFGDRIFSIATARAG